MGTELGGFYHRSSAVNAVSGLINNLTHDLRGVDLRVPQFLSERCEIATDNDAMKALQRVLRKLRQNPKHKEVLQQYGTVYRVRCTQELFGIRRGE
jgi:hypothetical protein